VNKASTEIPVTVISAVGQGFVYLILFNVLITLVFAFLGERMSVVVETANINLSAGGVTILDDVSFPFPGRGKPQY
jgi:hypothetical protein